jgi:hypothetical protein
MFRDSFGLSKFHREEVYTIKSYELHQAPIMHQVEELGAIHFLHWKVYSEMECF